MIIGGGGGAMCPELLSPQALGIAVAIVVGRLQFLTASHQFPHVCCLECSCCRDELNVLDYIQVKDEVSQLGKQAADWRRKVDIAEMERQHSSRLLRTVSSMKAASRPPTTV